MSDELLVGVFVPGAEGAGAEGAPADDVPSAYLFVVDKRVSGAPTPMPARNVTLLLHASVGAAVVVPRGRPGRRGFDSLRAKHGVPPPPPAARRTQPSSVERRRERDAGASVVRVVVEMVGGGGALVRLQAADAAALLDACFSFVDWVYDPGTASLAVHSPTMDVALKAPQWAYDSWHARYRPYAGLELTTGRSFEEGEQTSFILGASFAGAAPPASAEDAQRWAWAGYNLLSLEAPPRADLEAYGPATAAVGAALDAGYSFGYFVAMEPAAAAASTPLAPEDVAAYNRAFRCHGRWAGLVVGRNVSAGASADAAVAAAAALRTFAKGNWLLPFASAASASVALELGKRGLPLAMPAVPSYAGGGEGEATAAITWAQAVVQQYEPMRAMLAASYVRPDPTSAEWKSEALMPFVAAVDACASDSDSLLRWAAFSAIAYGARGLFWQNAARCAPLGSPKFGLLASINRRLAGWGNTFVADWTKSDFAGGGYNVTRMWSTGFPLPHTVAPGSGGASDLVQSADADVLVVALGDQGRLQATPLLYIVDQRVDPTPGAAAVRTLQVRLRPDVTATQPIEGDCAASRCQCGLGLLGNLLTLKLPGGSGQLVALALRAK